MQETKSNWENVASFLKNKVEPVSMGKYSSYWFYNTPRRMLHSLSYYKFAAKMIGKGRKVLDIGCNDGLGTYLLAKECGVAKGIDFDDEAISKAKSNYSGETLTFSNEDILTSSHGHGKWDAVTSFDVIEHIFPKNVPDFFKAINDHLSPNGIAIIGTPSLISQQFASEIARKGHVNIYDPERLEKEMRNIFEYVFLFAASDEIVHTGYLPLAHYLIAIGAKKKQSTIEQ